MQLKPMICHLSWWPIRGSGEDVLPLAKVEGALLYRCRRLALFFPRRLTCRAEEVAVSSSLILLNLQKQVMLAKSKTKLLLLSALCSWFLSLEFTRAKVLSWAELLPPFSWMTMRQKWLCSSPACVWLVMQGPKWQEIHKNNIVPGGRIASFFFLAWSILYGGYASCFLALVSVQGFGGCILPWRRLQHGRCCLVYIGVMTQLDGLPFFFCPLPCGLQCRETTSMDAGCSRRRRRRLCLFHSSFVASSKWPPIFRSSSFASWPGSSTHSIVLIPC